MIKIKNVTPKNEIKVKPINKELRTIYYSSVEIEQLKIGSKSLLLVTVTDVTEFEKFKIKSVEMELEKTIELKKMMRTDTLKRLIL